MTAHYLTGLFYRRPRILNVLHFLRLASPHNQTNQAELTTLQRYATGKTSALEIGTYMGVSTGAIAKKLSPSGKLYCVDPWLDQKGQENPCFSICRRQLAKQSLLDRIVFIHATSTSAKESLPERFDFIFVDGDHSY